MAKRTIIECELCWGEKDPIDLTILSTKQEKKSQQYEICSECLAKLKQQLVSNKKLDKNWSFENKTTVELHPASLDEDPTQEEETEENNIFERHSNRERFLQNISVGGDIPRQEKIVSGGPQTIEPEGRCKHYNKTPMVKGTIDGKEMFFQRCKTCNIVIKPTKK